MVGIAVILGLILGCILRIIINKMSNKIGSTKILLKGYYNILVVLLSTLVTILCYFKFGINMIFIKGIFLGCILIVVTFIDIKYRTIPNFIVIITTIFGIFFIFTFQITPLNAIFGAFIGGGLLFILALIPGSIGGGDVKLMFALGLFLGINKTLLALLLAFLLGAIASIFLIIFKKKGHKDYIPFGPFLAIGSFISLLL